MTIDPTKIRVGDEVTWQRTGKVAELSSNGMSMFRVPSYGWIEATALLSHTPAPRPFVVGGKVQYRGGLHPHFTLTLLAQHNDQLWVEYSNGLTELVQSVYWEPCN